MAKKSKNKFNHNSEKNAQKQCKKEKKLDNLNQIKKDFPAKNTNVNNKSNNVREKVDIFETISQKLALLSSKPKVWLKTQAKILDDAFKSQLIPQIKTIAKVIEGKISIFNKIKPNFKLIESTSTLEKISESNKIENSSIQYIPESSPPLPKLMTLNVTPTAQLAGIINNLLQKYYEESAIYKSKMKKEKKNHNFKNMNYHIHKIYEILDKQNAKIIETLENRTRESYHKLAKESIYWCSTIKCDTTQKTRIPKAQVLETTVEHQGPVIENNFTITYETEQTSGRSTILQLLEDTNVEIETMNTHPTPETPKLIAKNGNRQKRLIETTPKEEETSNGIVVEEGLDSEDSFDMSR
jgi:hypothetical protein